MADEVKSMSIVQTVTTVWEYEYKTRVNVERISLKRTLRLITVGRGRINLAIGMNEWFNLLLYTYEA